MQLWQMQMPKEKMDDVQECHESKKTFFFEKKKHARLLILQNQQVKKRSQCHEAFTTLFPYRRYEDVIYDRFEESLT